MIPLEFVFVNLGYSQNKATRVQGSFNLKLLNIRYGHGASVLAYLHASKPT